jgi:hypothetical protein
MTGRCRAPAGLVDWKERELAMLTHRLTPRDDGDNNAMIKVKRL